MITGIMQPYFFPYIGYYQLINAVDVFVVYDNLKYVKQSWINRNRILIADEIGYITLPLSHDSDEALIKERELHNWDKEKKIQINRLINNYYRSPFYRETMPVITEILNYDNTNLFNFLHNSIVKICEHIGINTPVIISSTIDIDHELKGKDKVLSICQKLKTDTYINAIGGIDLYDKKEFLNNDITLYFLQSNNIRYKQFGGAFQHSLSIIDVLMFNGREHTKELLNEYELI